MSWKVYNPPGTAYQPSNPISIAISDNILLYFSQFKDPASTLLQEGVRSGLPRPTSPATWPTTRCRRVVDHPARSASTSTRRPHPRPASGSPTRCSSTLVSNPKVWASTVLFVMYDENDGFFDHVAPPIAAAGHAGRVPHRPIRCPPTAKGITGPIGLGFRVPMLVVSPFSRGGYVCSDTFDHTSQLRFLETRFGVAGARTSRPGGARRSATSPPRCTWPRPTPRRPPLPATPKRAQALAECQSSQLLSDRPPRPGALSACPIRSACRPQEPGRARPRPR